MLTLAMFLVSFAWSLVYVGLPFHVQHVSTASPAATLAWTGWILGVTALAAVVTTPLASRLAARGDPRTACVVVLALQGVGFAVTGLARTLPQLFLARLGLGLVGSASTFAFMIAGRTPGAAEMRRRLAAVQSAIMVGSVVGPLPGAVASARIGFRVTFGLGGLVLAAAAALVQWGLPRSPEAVEVAATTRQMAARDVMAAAALVLVASSQETFLAAVLPGVLPGLGVDPQDTLEIGGVLLFVSGAAAALGGLAAPLLAEQVPGRRLVPALLGGSSILLALLGAAGPLWLFTAIRVVQSAWVAPLFPLVVARVARHGGGTAIGVVNAARVGSSFVGPVVATSMLAWSPPAALYLALALAGSGFAYFAYLAGGRESR